MGFPDTVNPYYAIGGDTTGSDIEVSDSMFDGLLTVTPDLKYAPDLALNVPTLHNGGVVLMGSGMDVTWTLRPGMEWSDGQPINCDDITATWQWVMDKDNAQPGRRHRRLAGCHRRRRRHRNQLRDALRQGVRGLSRRSSRPLLPAHYITTIPVKDARTKLYPMSNLSSGVYSGPYIPVSSDGPHKDHPEAEPELADHQRSRAVAFVGDLEVLRRRRLDDRRVQDR